MPRPPKENGAPIRTKSLATKLTESQFEELQVAVEYYAIQSPAAFVNMACVAFIKAHKKNEKLLMPLCFVHGQVIGKTSASE